MPAPRSSLPPSRAQMNVPIIGVVENMSYFKCGNCGQEHEIFKRIAGADRDGAAPTSTFYDADGRGAEGGAAEGPAERRQLPLLCRVPIAPGVCSASEAGTPVAVAAPESDAGRAFAAAARKIWDAVANETNGKATEAARMRAGGNG